MIRIRYSFTSEQQIDFPDTMKIQNGDGMLQMKNPANNEIVFQCPVGSATLLRLPNQDKPLAMPPEPPSDVPDGMQGTGEVQP